MSPISYQKKYTLKKIADGKCISCGKGKIYRWSLCKKHYESKKTKQREYQEKNKEEQKIRCAKFRRDNPHYFRKWYRDNLKK